jgi:FSR family fosmidomycin resistance protein-like MFS transporter
MSSLAKIAPEKIAPEAPPAESIDYKSIALLSAAHLTDDVNQGVVPAMLPFFIASDHLTYAAAAGLILAQTFVRDARRSPTVSLADSGGTEFRRYRRRTGRHRADLCSDLRSYRT